MIQTLDHYFNTLSVAEAVWIKHYGGSIDAVQSQMMDATSSQYVANRGSLDARFR